MNTTQFELNQAEIIESPGIEIAEAQIKELQQCELMLVGGGSGDVIF